ncbi:hypothetical protein A2U01_0018638 [Trifolium medium]|uniref:Uncharacterized protein n=1 Tax=Trifolium medium TaxID=97028 RepID=A0A392NE94_9FABA|nr:hypothetical protein [Trifolium medium]
MAVRVVVNVVIGAIRGGRWRSEWWLASACGDKDPLIEDTTRCKEVLARVLVGDVVNLEEKIFHRVDQQRPRNIEWINKASPDMRIVGPYNDTLTT